MIREQAAFVAVILAAANFEWTVRRAILALGASPTKQIRSDVLSQCAGLDAYKAAWEKEVKPYVGKTLPEVIPDWQFFKPRHFLFGIGWCMAFGGLALLIITPSIAWKRCWKPVLLWWI